MRGVGFAFYAKKRRGVAFAFYAKKRRGVAFTFYAKKRRSVAFAFYAKKRNHRVVSWMFFSKRRTPKKLLKQLEAGMRVLSHSQLQLLSCRVRMFFPKGRTSKSFL